MKAWQIALTGLILLLSVLVFLFLREKPFLAPEEKGFLECFSSNMDAEGCGFVEGKDELDSLLQEIVKKNYGNLLDVKINKQDYNNPSKEGSNTFGFDISGVSSSNANVKVEDIVGEINSDNRDSVTSLEDVVSAVNKWVEGTMSLNELVKLINDWIIGSPSLENPSSSDNTYLDVGNLHFLSTQEDAIIYINGEFSGTTPQAVDLETDKDYTYNLQLADCKKVSGNLRLNKDERKKISVAFFESEAVDVWTDATEFNKFPESFIVSCDNYPEPLLKVTELFFNQIKLSPNNQNNKNDITESAKIIYRLSGDEKNGYFLSIGYSPLFASLPIFIEEADFVDADDNGVPD